MGHFQESRAEAVALVDTVLQHLVVDQGGHREEMVVDAAVPDSVSRHLHVFLHGVGDHPAIQQIQLCAVDSRHDVLPVLSAVFGVLTEGALRHA